MGRVKRISTPLGQRLRRARVSLLPLLLWLVAAAGAGQLWLSTPVASTYIGLAQAPEFQLTSPVDGRLDGLFVGLYESVEAGDVIAALDSSGLDARMATARAEFERMGAELDAQRASIEFELRELETARERTVSVASLEYPAELRAFHGDEADLELTLLESHLAITSSALEADRLEVRLRRARALADAGLGPLSEVEDLEKQLEQERARTGSLELLEAGQKAKLEQARERQQELARSYEPPPTQSDAESGLEARLAGWKAAILVQRKRLEELDLLRAAFVLRAPAAGRVAALAVSEGQFLLAGDPVCVLMDWRANEVALWVPEGAPRMPQLGERCLVKRGESRREDSVAEGIVLAMSPRLEPLPQRLWHDPRIAEFGRVCRVGPLAALGLTPGERVRIDPLDGAIATRP